MIIGCLYLIYEGYKKEQEIVTQSPLVNYRQTYCKISLWIIQVVQALLAFAIVQSLNQIYFLNVPGSFWMVIEKSLMINGVPCEKYIDMTLFNEPLDTMVFYVYSFQSYGRRLCQILILVLQFMEWYAMLKLVRYQDTRSLGEITYETLNQSVDEELRKNTFRAREKKLHQIITRLGSQPQFSHSSSS